MGIRRKADSKKSEGRLPRGMGQAAFWSVQTGTAYCPVIMKCPRRFHFHALSSWPRTKGRSLP